MPKDGLVDIFRVLGCSVKMGDGVESARGRWKKEQRKGNEEMARVVNISRSR